MSKRVVFLDDGSVTSRRLKRGLQAAGIKCLDASTDGALREHLRDESALAVLHVPTHPQRFSSLWTRFVQDFPRVPVLHVIEEANFQAHEWLRSPFHEWLDITTTIPTLMRRIDTLAHFASLEARLTESQRQASRIDHFTRSISSVENMTVMRTAIDIFQTELAASQVLWFPEDLLTKEIERFVSVQDLPPERRKPARMLWSASGEVSRESLEQIFKNWQTNQGTDWTKASELREIKSENGLKDYVITVQAPKAKDGTIETLGHIVLIEPRHTLEIHAGPVFPAYLERLGHQLKEANEYGRLERLTYKDDLTDLYNQRYLPRVLDQELNRASSTAREFSVLFCDVDFFKLVNDTKGHMVGSKVLIELSKIFQTSIRATDFAFRYGGDEYVIVLSGANSQNAALVAERLRKKAADATFDINGNSVKITVSIGIATFPEHAKSAEEILQMADEAMYYGKHKSRNVVHIAS